MGKTQTNFLVNPIYKGRLLQKALKETRISINELMAAARGAGVGDISEIDYAILEQNGTISILEKKKGAMAHPVVIDGTVTKEAESPEIKKILENKGFDLSGIFLMTVDDDGRINIIKKEKDG
jgi:uncharacterized membrane protein YcaP (DUF421 family)